jgi:hypothetical protein
MANNYWIKLYHEILHDPKMGRLPDNVWRRCIELFLLAGEMDSDGTLPSTDDLAWLLHQPDSEQLEAELSHLERVGVLSKTESGWMVANFTKRQARVSDAERMKAYRQRKRQSEMEEYDPELQAEMEAETERDSNVSPSVSGNDTETLQDGYELVTRTVTKRNAEVDIDTTSNEVTENSVEAAGQSSRTKRSTDNDGLTADSLRQAGTALKLVMATFLDKSEIPKMPGKKNEQKFWWSEIQELYRIADKDVGKAQSLVEMAVSELQGNKLTINSPKSIVPTARRLAGNLTENGSKLVASY